MWLSSLIHSLDSDADVFPNSHLLAEDYVVRIDSVLGQRLSAVRMFAKQTMAVVVKISNQRYIAIHLVEMIRIFGTAAASGELTVIHPCSEPVRPS